jgi:hypothetical protein
MPVPPGPGRLYASDPAAVAGLCPDAIGLAIKVKAIHHHALPPAEAILLVAVIVVVQAIQRTLHGIFGGQRHLRGEVLLDVDAGGGKDAGKDTSLEGSTLGARQARQQRGRRDQIAAEPLAIIARFDDVELVAEFQGEVISSGRIEGVCRYRESYPRQRRPRHLDFRVFL